MSDIAPEDEMTRRKQLKNARNRSYYERHREDIRTRKRESYNPEKKREYYFNNHAKVLESQRASYKKKQTVEKLERLNALLTITQDEGLKKLIQNYIENPDELKLSEVLTLEKSIILAVNKSETL